MSALTDPLKLARSPTSRGRRWDHLELLERIDASGSISAAANAMGMSYKAAWDGPVLVIVTTGSFGDNAIRLTDRYTLSGDGKTLTLLRHYEGRGGPQDQTLLLRREQQ